MKEEHSADDHWALWYFVGAFSTIVVAQLVHATLIPRAVQLWLPEASLVLLLGMLGGGLVRASNHAALLDAVSFSPWVFFHVLLPPIVFYAGYSLEKHHGHVFFSNIGTITLLAVFGTAASAAITAGFMELVVRSSPQGAGRWTTAECFLFGTLTGATDPVATLSIFKAISADDTIYNLVFGESVLNDAAAIVLFRVIQPYADTARSDGGANATGEAVGNAFELLAKATGGSLAIGLGGGVVVSLVLKLAARSHAGTEGTNEAVHDEMADVPTLLVYVAGLLLYGAAEAAEMSGILTLVVYSIVAGHYAYFNMSEAQRRVSIEFSRVVGSLFELFVFGYIGVAATAAVPKTAWSGELIASAIPICMLARACAIFPIFTLCNLVRRRKIPIKAQFLCVAAGLRGAVAFALALSAGSPNSDTLVATTLGVVVFTTIVLGGITAPLANLLGVGAGGSDRRKALFDDDGGTTPRPADAAPSTGAPVLATEPPRTSKMWFLRLDRNFLRPLLCTAAAVAEMEANEREIANDPQRLAEIAGNLGVMRQAMGAGETELAKDAGANVDSADVRIDTLGGSASVMRKKSGGSIGLASKMYMNAAADADSTP